MGRLRCSEPPPGLPTQHLDCPVWARAGLGPACAASALALQCVQLARRAEREPKNSLAPRAPKSPGQSAGINRPSSRVWVTGSGPRPQLPLAHTPPRLAPLAPPASGTRSSSPWRHGPAHRWETEALGSSCQASQVRAVGVHERRSVVLEMGVSRWHHRTTRLRGRAPGQLFRVLGLGCSRPCMALPPPALGLPPAGPAASLAQMVVGPIRGSPQ